MFLLEYVAPQAIVDLSKLFRLFPCGLTQLVRLCLQLFYFVLLIFIFDLQFPHGALSLDLHTLQNLIFQFLLPVDLNFVLFFFWSALADTRSRTGRAQL